MGMRAKDKQMTLFDDSTRQTAATLIIYISFLNVRSKLRSYCPDIRVNHLNVGKYLKSHIHTHTERERERDRDRETQREREREREREKHTHTHTYIYIYIYIYIYCCHEYQFNQ